MSTDSIVPRSAVATPDQVKTFLALTDEQVAELQKEQRLALYRSRARLSDNERRIARGIELEQHYRLTGNAAGLAEALSLQGRYEEAADVADSEELRRVLAERHNAVESSDENCPCDNFVETGDYNLPTQYVEFYGHSHKHGREVPFIRCTTCGTLNARPSLPHLAEQQQVRHSDKSDSVKLKYFKK